MGIKTYKFHTKGMHCKSCALFTESELEKFPYVKKVKASSTSSLVEISGEFDEKTPEEIAEDLNKMLSPHGYTLHAEKVERKINWKEFKVAIQIAVLFIVLFIFLQKIGLVNFINITEVSYSSAFIIGIIASLSSCMAVVAGLVLSMSASFAKEGEKIKPQVMFHVGRLVSFFVLGGIIGEIGSIFQLSSFWIFFLDFLIAFIMLILGLDLLGIFSWTKALQPVMPKFLSKNAINVSKINHVLTPAFVGIVTFFLPCGFTQSMQLYALKTENFLSGGLIMLSFALGTLPILAVISFSSLSVSKNKNAGVFYKTAGLIVILFALFNIMNAMVLLGIMHPIF